VGRAVLIALVASCYSPDVRDCTVTCSDNADCADGQRCGSDHLCAAPDHAGRCGDAPADARPRDGHRGASDDDPPAPGVTDGS